MNYSLLLSDNYNQRIAPSSLETSMYRCVAVALFLLSFHLSLQARPAEKITGIYSDMAFNEDAGDVTGIEIFLVFSKTGYVVVFQDAEGVPSEPVVVPATVDHGDIHFSLPEREGYRGTFSGHIRNGVLVGHFDGAQQADSGGRTFRLKKKKSYWQ